VRSDERKNEKKLKKVLDPHIKIKGVDSERSVNTTDAGDHDTAKRTLVRENPIRKHRKTGHRDRGEAPKERSKGGGRKKGPRRRESLKSKGGNFTSTLCKNKKNHLREKTQPRKKGRRGLNRNGSTEKKVSKNSSGETVVWVNYKSIKNSGPLSRMKKKTNPKNSHATDEKAVR